MLRSGLIDAPRYLKLLGDDVDRGAGGARPRVQSVAAASFDAWVKYYRADENTPNSTISYYAKGSLVALALDLTLRSEGAGSLDDVMRRLWQHSEGGPIDEADIAGRARGGGRALVRGRDRRLGARHRRAAAARLLRRFGVEIEAPGGHASRSASACAPARARSPASR